MRHILFNVARHATLLKIMLALAVIAAIALAGGAPNAYDP